MKKHSLLLLIICCFLLSGCTDKKKKSYELKSMDLSGLPVVKIIGAEEGTLPIAFPDQEQITETKGTIAGYAVTDEGAYYIVSYDNTYRDFMCRQYAVYKQAFGSSEFELLAEKLYDEGRSVASATTENGKFVWYQVNEQQDIMYKCTIENASIVEVALEAKEGEYAWDTMERDLTEAFAGWEQEIPKEYLSDQIHFVGQTDSYTVFTQKLEDPYAEGRITDSYINIYDRKLGKMKQIRMEDYGSVMEPVLSGNFIMFLTIDDIKSYSEDDDSYENVYLVQLDTMEIQKITENSGKETDTTGTIFHSPCTSDGYLYFIEMEHTYKHLYYLKAK
ncbi:MAG: hypothetical protein K2G45_04840 [Lachnospiraceae bacterium]|nr:hypothetical protein [Lachnospiraceae bacterium]